nr:hypothetical protein Iba_chr15bCG10310 [Ipomoea batatas]
MDMFTRFSYEEVQHNKEGDTISYFLHTLHGRRYCIFEMSRQRSQSKYTLDIAQMWLVLMKVMGFQLTFPANINTKRRAEHFLNSFLRGSINFDFGRLGSHPCFYTRIVGHPHHPSVQTITWFLGHVWSPWMLQFLNYMHIHILQHVSLTAQLFHRHAHPWELPVENLDFYHGLEDFYLAHGIQEDDVLIFRHIGYFKFHFFVIRNKQQLVLPEVHGDGVEREPAEDGEAIYVPARSSINFDVGWTTLSGCRTLMIGFDEFCDDQSTLANFIFWTESGGDSVALRHSTFTLTFINVRELINYSEQCAFLIRMLWNHRRVIRSLVFFNYEVGEVHLIAFDMCGIEIMTEDLYVYNIEDYANVDVGV